MPNPEWQYIDLPPDPKDLTLEHARLVFARPEVLFEALGRLTAPRHQELEHTPSNAPMRERQTHGA